MASFLDDEPEAFDEGTSAAGPEAAAFFDQGDDDVDLPAGAAAAAGASSSAAAEAAGAASSAAAGEPSSSAAGASGVAADFGAPEHEVRDHGAVSKAEDVSELQFSEAMQGVKAEFLSNTEAAILLNFLSEQSTTRGRPKEDERFTQSLQYSNSLGLKPGTAGDTANVAVEELRSILENNTFASGAGTDVPGVQGDRLHKFEVTALANLRPSEPDEARALIPSLARFDDADIRDMINTVIRSFARLEEE
jgi:hypothetical protein